MSQITLQNFMEAVNYRITEGTNYGWGCYGPNAFTLDSWDGNHDGHSVSLVFDTRTQEVYELCAHDYENLRAYRWINPAYLSSFLAEVAERRSMANQAWDDVNYVDLEMAADILEKTCAIVNGQEYDTRVMLPIDLPENELFQLMLLAHEQDITLNTMVEQILRREILKKEPDYDTND